VTTESNPKTTMKPCIITLHNNRKAEWNRQVGCGVGTRAQAIFDDCNWSRSQKLLHGGPKAEPEIRVPVTQSRFVGKAS